MVSPESVQSRPVSPIVNHVSICNRIELGFKKILLPINSANGGTMLPVPNVEPAEQKAGQCDIPHRNFCAMGRSDRTHNTNTTPEIKNPLIPTPEFRNNLSQDQRAFPSLSGVFPRFFSSSIASSKTRSGSATFATRKLFPAASTDNQRSGYCRRMRASSFNLAGSTCSYA